MRRRIRSFLLAVVAAAASLPLAQPAQALLEPQWECGYVAIRDIENNAERWLAAEYAWFVGVPGVHTEIRVTCWVQYSAEYTGTGATSGYWNPVSPEGPIVRDTVITCTANNPPLTSNACIRAPLLWYDLHPSAMDTWWCEHVVWTDMVTGQTVTRRSDPCLA